MPRLAEACSNVHLLVPLLQWEGEACSHHSNGTPLLSPVSPAWTFRRGVWLVPPEEGSHIHSPHQTSWTYPSSERSSQGAISRTCRLGLRARQLLSSFVHLPGWTGVDRRPSDPSCFPFCSPPGKQDTIFLMALILRRWFLGGFLIVISFYIS